MKIAVVIPALNESDRIDRCVASARAPGVEVVVADGGSRDGTAVCARRAGAVVIEAPLGRARQLAAGVEFSAGDVVVLLHADTTLPVGYPDAVRAALEDPATVGGSFRLRFDSRSRGLRLIEAGVGLRMALFNLPYGDQAIFVRRQVLEQIGGIPDVSWLEDLDLVHALKRKGRLARLASAVTTSARRYGERGVVRMMLRNWVALAAWRLGFDRERIAAWYAG